MATGFSACPYCGRKVLKGAMRCPGCGKILKTSDEQAESIRRFQEAQKKSGRGGFIMTVIIIAMLIAAGFRYREEIMAIIRTYLP